MIRSERLQICFESFLRNLEDAFYTRQLDLSDPKDRKSRLQSFQKATKNLKKEIDLWASIVPKK